ncbi:MAG: beta-lactamase family protein [Actinobacteria bacterium]|nr:MAG: beta-lactamase family protein [Actinomycetota bacterium]
MNIDELLDRAVAGGVVPGIVAVVADRDGIVHEGAAGAARPDTLFRIASMTKAMTSVAALRLVERGELRLDQPVADILPAFGDLHVLEGFDGDQPRLRPPARPVTITHLLTHTSGLGYWFSSDELVRWHELTGAPTILTGRRASIDTPLIHDPGERWTYGVSTDWLGQIVEAVSGRSLEDQLREHVWGPLDMPDATFFPTGEQRSRLMELVSRTPDGALGPSPFVEPEPEFASGGGGGYATARDYARFQRALLRGGELDGARILQRETVELMFADHLHGAPLPEVMRSAVPELTNDVPSLPFKQGWGLGLHIVLEDIPGMRRAGTGDWAGLFNCYFWIDRKSGISAALMTQLLPFFDARMVETLLGFEAAVYAELGAVTAA